MLTVSSAALFDSTAGFWGCLIQPDVTDEKQQIINRPGSAAGGFGLELLGDGTLHAYRRDGTGTIREITSASGIVAAGEAAHVGMSWGEAALRLFKNGSVIASEDTPTTDWAVTNTNDIRFGRWQTGVDGFDGLM